ncbi:MAG: nicotinate phosphoribosyltransferase [Spirochaetota bacterium]
MNPTHSALFTDLYELTMIQGYYKFHENHDVVFDMFFRRPPFGGGFTIFAGLDDLIDQLEQFRFSDEDIDYLRNQELFDEEFLDYLRDFRFRGEVHAMEEGSVVFPNEPLIRIHSSLIEAQLIEGMLLNTINFQTLIATKAARVYTASNKGLVLEFGLRRAQGQDGAMSASRAAFIGGAAATSNTLAGKRFGIPVKGTMAHSWVMAFESERESFERYAELYPDATILLIDTYSTLGSGIEHAIAVGKELKKKGHRFGVRLDSGDLEYLSKQVRKRLDKAGLTDAQITASNELNEEIIHQLITSGSPIDSWGVGTSMVTGGDDSSLTGVYKLAAKGNGELQPTIKISNQPAKTTNPGTKQVHRFRDADGSPLADLIALDSESVSEGERYTFNHPDLSARKFEMAHYGSIEPMLALKMTGGRRMEPVKPLTELQQHCIASLEEFDETYKRIINPHIYKVSLSNELAAMKRELIDRYTTEI